MKKAVFLLPALLAGCAPGLGGGDYARTEARQVQQVRMGQVLAVRQVQIEGTRTGVGAAAGAAIGGIAGASATDSRLGQVAGGILGGLAGGVAGQAIEEMATRRRGIEVTVRLDSGETIAVVQAADAETAALRPGERVRVIGSYGSSRVARE